MFANRKRIEALRVGLWLLAAMCAVVLLTEWGHTYPRFPSIAPLGWIAMIVAVGAAAAGLACHLWLEPPPEDD